MVKFLDDKLFAKIQWWLTDKGLMKLPNKIQDFRALWNKYR